MSLKEVFEKVKDFIFSNGIRLIVLFAVLLFGIIAVKCVGKILKRAFLRARFHKPIAGLIASIVKFLLYLLLLFVLASIIGIDLQPVTTILLSAGLALSLALQDSLSNVANGIIIATSKPFTIGDHVETGSVSGVVSKIGMIFTELTTFDNRKISIPNAKIMSDSVVNYTANTTRRVDLVISVAKDSDLALVKTVLFATLKTNPLTLSDPEPTVRMASHTENSFNYNVRPWVKTEDYWDIYWALTEQIAIDLAANGIKIPHKTIDIVMDNPQAKTIKEPSQTDNRNDTTACK